MYWILFTVLAAWLVWYALSRVGARVIFRPQKKRWPMKLPFENISFPAPDGKSITGVWLPAKNAKPTLLFFHGRGGNVSHFEKFALAYAPLGYGILMTDYRGFGLSAGKPSQTHLFEDGVCAARFLLKEKKIRPQDIVIFGHSLGNAAALHVSAALGKLPWKAVILQSPFLSTPDMAVSFVTHTYEPKSFFYRAYKAFVTPFLWFNRFENTLPAARLTAPVLVCMSKADATIPWKMTAHLADCIPHAKRFLSAKGGHDEFAWAANAANEFLKSN
ncbi:MAG: alpha/beta fold hydrolase [Elusimicrobiaceae bacterium]|nr:alpha/beta fold hydrolase [Elusimicrobiaceae bacterium]